MYCPAVVGGAASSAIGTGPRDVGHDVVLGVGSPLPGHVGWIHVITAYMRTVYDLHVHAPRRILYYGLWYLRGSGAHRL